MESAAEQAIVERLEALEMFMSSNKLPGPPGIERDLAKTVLNMEIFVST